MRHAGDDLDCQDFATVRTKSAKLRTEIFGCGDDIARLRNKTPGLSGDALPTLAVGGEIAIVDALVGLGFCASKGEARRLIKGGGARVDGDTVEDDTATVRVSGAAVRISAGKKHHGLLIAP